MFMRSFFLCIFLYVTTFGSNAFAQTGVAWPEANRLFHSDPQWLGADGAFSIDLGNGRVLWTFNDSFIARTPGDKRRRAAFVHNTVAIQRGYDPSHATIRFYWRVNKGMPSEVYPTEGPVWMWPSSGIRIGNKLLLFATRVSADHSEHSLGFKLLGWNAYWVSNPDAEPSAWKLTIAAQKNDMVIMASALIRKGEYIYAFGESEPEHDLYVARMKVSALAKGHLGTMEWWTGNTWQAAEARRHPIQAAVGTELSIQANPRGDGYIEVHSRGFGKSDIVMQQAKSLVGPWSDPIEIYRPPESDVPDAFVYAGKSHSELRGADLILTYVANGPDDQLANDLKLYFPQFVKVHLNNP